MTISKPTSTAPILLFTYNRSDHTQMTLNALKKNLLAESSDLYIFLDAAKSESQKSDVQQTREVIQKATGFRKKVIIERDENFGLARSIIEGVSSIIKEYGKVIVLEDDIVTAPGFLTFMNAALNFHQKNKKIWHISGWNYPIKTDGLQDSFPWQGMNCWGWATWDDRWSYFEKKPSQLISEFSEEDIFKFNLNGKANFWGQVLANQSGKTSTWAVFWYATIFKKQGLCLNASQTLVNNIGHDGSGVHLGEDESFNSPLNQSVDFSFQEANTESKLGHERIHHFYLRQQWRYPIKMAKKVIRLLLRKLKN